MLTVRELIIQWKTVKGFLKQHLETSICELAVTYYYHILKQEILPFSALGNISWFY